MSTTQATFSANPSLVERARRKGLDAVGIQPVVPFTLDQHCQHALLQAAQHVVGASGARNPLRRQLERATRILRSTQQIWNRMVGEGKMAPPAALGLLENFHLIEEHLAIARQEARRRFSSPLPQLATGSTFGVPRIYQIAAELISHSDGQCDVELLTEVITLYQSRATLTLRKLWAFSAMLRLAVLEHLSRVALRLANPTSDNVGAASDADIQTAEQVSINTGIGALRNLGSVDWRGFVEEQSCVEAALRRDPLAIYPQMSPQSRDRYRQVVENLAVRSPLTEAQVADAAVELANVGRVALDSGTRTNAAREGMKERHVGYFLVDKGRAALEARIGCRPGRLERIARAAFSAPLACFITSIVVVWSAAMAGAAFVGWFLGAGHFLSAGSATALMIVWAGIAAECAVRIVNSLCTMFIKPRAIMRLDFSEGIPDDCRTLVAVPTMLSSERAVRDLVELLEIRYLANRDENLLFALVTDFPDAASESLPTDAALLELARTEIKQLNDRHGVKTDGIESCGPFYLLHRPRKWNSQENKWMGEERKRGKLHALNGLLRGHDGDFAETVGELDELLSVRYVITLDSDTQLPRDAARELIASMAHPLNRPRIDRQKRMVVEGHALLQPRVATTMPEARRSIYANIFSGDAGTDPYTQQTSDVYQDVFGEGSFIGKGIYDVDAFETVLQGRFPDNRVLSHDLIEGCFARSGLVDDIELFEGFPSRLPADMSRRHRWIRGDWQIAAWLFQQAPTTAENAELQENPLSMLSRWKIADNLRRSMSPVAMFAFVMGVWFLAPALATAAAGLVLAAIFGPELVGLIPGCFLKPSEKPWGLHLSDRLNDVCKILCRETINWSILPYTVHCNIDAVIRAGYRMAITRRKMLEWTTASEAERRCSTGCRNYYELLWASPVAGLAVIAWLAIVQPSALATAGLLAALWIVAPLAAWLISRPSTNDAAKVSEAERTEFRLWSRRTWHFFDTFVNAESNGLPPDNVQFNAHATGETAVVAHRTSPTNIGLSLLADLSAYDLGFLSAPRLLERTNLTLQTLHKLERYRGHFLNWYNTQTLEPLGQRYVSAVDSGNLRGAFVVMQAAMDELRNRPLVSAQLRQGFLDTMGVLAQVTGTPLSEIKNQFAQYGPGARATIQFIESVEVYAAKVSAGNRAAEPIIQDWLAALRRQCENARGDIAGLAFWLDDDGLRQLETSLTQENWRELRDEVVAFQARLAEIDRTCTLSQLPTVADESIRRIGALCELLSKHDLSAAISKTALASINAQLVAMAGRAAATTVALANEWRLIQSVAETCQSFSNMDYRFLYNKARKLLAIGFNVTEHRLDGSCYDLLASECRLASFLAVCDGQLPIEHWAALGRTVAVHDGTPTLISWSGSMFEYLMPMLVMPSYRTSFIDTSCRRAVGRQMKYASQHGLPWGISESCFSRLNDDGSYAYRAFGVPGLRLEKQCNKTFVIAPYASALASMVAPRAACRNMKRLESHGALSSYGFYDAVDFSGDSNAGEKASAGKMRPGDNQSTPCRTVMSHHSGMALVAMANVLLDSPMQRRFMVDPRVRAHDLLLQQRMPQSVRPVNWQKHESSNPLTAILEANPSKVSVFEAAQTDADAHHSLGTVQNGVVLTAAGSPGRYCYLRDIDSDEVWSNTLQPTMVRGDRSQAVFSPGRAQYRVLNQQINAQTLITYSAADSVEIRRLKLTNLARLERSIELTTFAEIGQSAIVEAVGGDLLGISALLASWPPQTEERAGWMFHLVRAIDPVRADKRSATPLGFESSRGRFIGPGRTLADPAAMDAQHPLSCTAGAMSDAILSLRQNVALGAGETVEVDIVTGLAATRDEAIAAIQRYSDPRLSWRLFETADAAARIQSCLLTVGALTTGA